MNTDTHGAAYAAARRAADEYAGGDRDKVWGSMIYACQGRKKGDGYDLPPCGHKERYYLGVGVEGPPVLRERWSREWQPAAEPWTPAGQTELLEEIERVGVGFIPSPFVAGRCTVCFGGEMGHILFADDETFEDLRDPPPGARYFRVPDAPAAAAFARGGFGGAELVVAPEVTS